MCGPWAIPLALIAAGSVSKYFGEKQATKARERTYADEQRRQTALTADQTSIFQDSLDKTKSLADPEAQAKAAQSREGTLSSAIMASPTAGSYLPGSSGAPSLVAVAGDKAAASSAATSSNLARTMAALGGTTDQMQGANIAIGRNSGRIGQLGSFKAGSASVLDAEMRAAARKGTFLRGVGDLAQTIGKAWMGSQAGAAPGVDRLDAPTTFSGIY